MSAWPSGARRREPSGSSDWSARCAGAAVAPAVADRVQLRLETGGARLLEEPPRRQRHVVGGPVHERAEAEPLASASPAPTGRHDPGSTATSAPPGRRRRRLGTPAGAGLGTRCGAAPGGRARLERLVERHAGAPRQALVELAGVDEMVHHRLVDLHPGHPPGGLGNRWRPGCQPQPTESTSPPDSGSRRPAALPAAPLALVVNLEVSGARRCREGCSRDKARTLAKSRLPWGVPLRVKWLIALACAAALAAVPAAAGAATETVPGEVIVRYASGTTASERAAHGRARERTSRNRSASGRASGSGSGAPCGGRSIA